MEKNELKDTNPKLALGIKKPPLHCVPGGPLFELGLAFMEGARKYGSHNYRALGVRASTYFDAKMRHIWAWWEGEDDDLESGVHHLIKDAACTFILRDSMLKGNWVDDRPLRNPLNTEELCRQAVEIIKKYPECAKPFLEEAI